MACSKTITESISSPLPEWNLSCSSCDLVHLSEYEEYWKQIVALLLESQAEQVKDPVECDVNEKVSQKRYCFCLLADKLTNQLCYLKQGIP